MHLSKIFAGVITVMLLGGAAAAQTTTITTNSTSNTRNMTIDRINGASRPEMLRAECVQRLQNDHDHAWGGIVHMSALCACASLVLENNLKAGSNARLSNAIEYCVTALQ